MSIEAESLIQPHGPVAASLFPDDTEPPATEEGSLLFRLNAYIAKAEEKLADYTVDDFDKAVENWALYLAFRDAHTLMASRYASEQFLGGLGGYSYSSKQLQTLADKASYYEAEFYKQVSETVEEDAVPKTPQTRSVITKAEY